MSDAASTTSAQKLTVCVSVSWISNRTSSLTSTLPPVSTKHPLRLRSVTVAFSRESTPSQRAGRLTLTRGADLLSFIRSMRKRAATAAVLRIEISAGFPEFRIEFFVERCLQITDSFRAAGAAFRADHAFDHLNVMRAPER